MSTLHKKTNTHKAWAPEGVYAALALGVFPAPNNWVRSACSQVTFSVIPTHMRVTWTATAFLFGMTVQSWNQSSGGQRQRAAYKF